MLHFKNLDRIIFSLITQLFDRIFDYDFDNFINA